LSHTQNIQSSYSLPVGYGGGGEGIGRNNRRGGRGSQILEETLMERDERMGD